MSFTALIDEIFSNLCNLVEENHLPKIDFSVEPAKSGFGDASSNISFLLAKHLKQKPSDIAKDLSVKYQKYLGGLVSKVTAHPSGHLNFFADTAKLNKTILLHAIDKDYGEIGMGKQVPVVIEHTSVNPNKALHIGHVRNIVIGDVLGRLLTNANYDVKILNYVDDSGLQVADLILGFKHLGFSESPPPNVKFDHYCGDHVYVKTTEKYQNDPSLQDRIKKILQQLEDEKSETYQFAQKITRKVLKCQLETCWNLGVYYDCLNFESQILHSGLWKKIFEKLKSERLIEFETEGKNKDCWVIRGDTKDQDKVIVRSNGTVTYIAKDIPYAAWKLGIIEDPFFYEPYEISQPSKPLWQTTLTETNHPKMNFHGSKVITVIDSRQSRLQQIIAKLMSKFSESGSYVHLSYESVTLSASTAKQLGVDIEGKQAQMSGRKGLYVNADSVLDLLQKKASKETLDRNPSWNSDEVEKIAHDIAIATIRYEMIKQDLDKIITFDLTQSLSLEGDTAPYIQYSYARAARILEKAETAPNFETGFSNLCGTYEKNLIRTIGLFESYVKDAVTNLSPKTIARYCYAIAVNFNSFYEHVKVLDPSEPSLSNQRLCLVVAFKNTLKNALSLLGIPSPSKM